MGCTRQPSSQGVCQNAFLFIHKPYHDGCMIIRYVMGFMVARRLKQHTVVSIECLLTPVFVEAASATIRWTISLRSAAGGVMGTI